MKTLIRLMPVLFVCVAAQSFAGDPPTSSPAADPAKTTPSASATTTAAATPAAAPAKQTLVLEDKTLTQDEVNRLLSQGYKPQKGRNGDVLYCRTEPQMGTHFEKKVCMTADQIKTVSQDSRTATESLQRNQGNAQGR